MEGGTRALKEQKKNIFIASSASQHLVDCCCHPSVVRSEHAEGCCDGGGGCGVDLTGVIVLAL